MSGKTKADFYEEVDSSISSPPPPEFGQAMQRAPVSKSQFATVTRNALDRINLINFSESEIAELYEVVRKNWPKGITTVYPREYSREFKLKGHPWGYDPNGCEESLLLVLRMVQALYNMGWVIYSAIEISKRIRTKGKGTAIATASGCHINLIIQMHLCSASSTTTYLPASGSTFPFTAATSSKFSTRRPVISSMMLLQLSSQIFRDMKLRENERKLNSKGSLGEALAKMTTRHS